MFTSKFSLFRSNRLLGFALPLQSIHPLKTAWSLFYQVLYPCNHTVSHSFGKTALIIHKHSYILYCLFHSTNHLIFCIVALISSFTSSITLSKPSVLILYFSSSHFLIPSLHGLFLQSTILLMSPLSLLTFLNSRSFPSGCWSPCWIPLYLPPTIFSVTISVHFRIVLFHLVMFFNIYIRWYFVKTVYLFHELQTLYTLKGSPIVNQTRLLFHYRLNCFFRINVYFSPRSGIAHIRKRIWTCKSWDILF